GRAGAPPEAPPRARAPSSTPPGARISRTPPPAGRRCRLGGPRPPPRGCARRPRGGATRGRGGSGSGCGPGGARRAGRGRGLRRGHERGLIARLDHGEGGEERHQRLAAADVPLEEPPHRMGSREVLLDPGEGALLRAGRAEREPRAQRGDETGRRRESRARLLPGGAPPEREAELEEEELVEDERAVREGAGRAERLEVG